MSDLCLALQWLMMGDEAQNPLETRGIWETEVESLPVKSPQCNLKLPNQSLNVNCNPKPVCHCYCLCYQFYGHIYSSCLNILNVYKTDNIMISCCPNKILQIIMTHPYMHSVHTLTYTHSSKLTYTRPQIRSLPITMWL